MDLGISIQSLDRTVPSRSLYFLPYYQHYLVAVFTYIHLRQSAIDTHSRIGVLRLLVYDLDCWLPHYRAVVLRRTV